MAAPNRGSATPVGSAGRPAAPAAAAGPSAARPPAEAHSGSRPLVKPAVPEGLGGDPLTSLAEQLYKELRDARVEVLYDDRDERPGVKFKDGDLLGIPYQVRIGKAFKEKKLLEVKIRKSGETQQVKPSELRQLFS